MTDKARETTVELLGRAAVGTLFLLLSVNLLDDFLRTQHLTGLMLLASESLVVVLTVVRRKAVAVDRSASTRVITCLALLGPALLRASTAPPLMPDAVTACIAATGLLVVISGKVALGRSFGIVPANRGIVSTGPYSMVRHPIYFGYLIGHIGFIAAHPTPWNIAVVLLGDAALVLRALREERVLQRDEQYRNYCGQVNWHLVPGVF